MEVCITQGGLLNGETDRASMVRTALRWFILAVVIATATSASAQQPFDIDMSFRTNIDRVYVNSTFPLEDGRISYPDGLGFLGTKWIALGHDCSRMESRIRHSKTILEWGGGYHVGTGVSMLAAVQWSDVFSTMDCWMSSSV